MDAYKNIHEQVLVIQMLAESMGKTSAIVDAFSGWMSAGFGAASTLFISQYDVVSKHICSSAIQSFFFLFLTSLGVGIIQKYFSINVISYYQGSVIGRDMIKKEPEKTGNLNWNFILEETKKSFIPPLRWFLSGFIAKIKKGDFIACSRPYFYLFQCQCLLALLQAILMMIAIYKIANSFHA